MTNQYLEKVYAGLLGMNIGIRLGAPVEPTIWTYERIRDTYGDITSYVKDYINFAADDDANGPFYFLRAMYDKDPNRELTPQDVADAWMNYAREGVGMFWWGGYGRSTEHTAYLNLKAGIPAPRSGSIEQNGATLAEQIGGQIFIDTWGLICPGNPEKAAQFGEIAASVSHDGEGVYGARFFTAAIAAAFEESDIVKVVRTALEQIPADSLYAKVGQAVFDCYAQQPEDWRICREMLNANWGYDKHPGVCHIIPNAGVCFMALLYGKGDFSRTVEIATMAGWDTDCNAGNVGTVLGVACGLAGLPVKYRAPINDFIVLSGVSGYLNVMDVPTYAKEVSLLGYRVAGEAPPEKLVECYRPGELYFDFELPGSTHGIRLSNEFFCKAKHSTEYAAQGSGSLEILVDRMERGNQCKVYTKTFYTRSDFSDERYTPVFSPLACSGQTFRAKLYLDQWTGWETLGIAPYVRAGAANKDILGGYTKLVPGEWVEICHTIPELDGDVVCEVGFIIEGYSPAKAKTLGRIFMDEFSITGKAEYRIDFAKQHTDFGSVTPFSYHHGACSKEGDKLIYMRCEPAFAFCGNYYSKDYTVSALVTPLSGESHLLLARAKGILFGYAAGLAPNGKAAIYKNERDFQVLAETDFATKLGEEYRIELEAVGDRLTLTIDGEAVLSVRDSSYTSGMYGLGSLAMGRTAFADYRVKEQ